MPVLTLDLWKQDISDDDLRAFGWTRTEDDDRRPWRHEKFGTLPFTRWDALLFTWYAIEESDE